jgi:N-acetylmuramic acid 6-phosphate (MurNAc-6-P) etherase
VVKTAIVMGRLGIGKEEAEHRLAQAHGRIRQVLEG